jgi:hypothetical protein
MYTSTKVEQISAFPPSRQQVCSSKSVILMLKIIWLFRVWQRTQRKNSLMTCSSYHACSRYSWFLILCMSVSMTICHLEHTHLSWKISSQTMGHDNWYHLSIEFRASCFFQIGSLISDGTLRSEKYMGLVSQQKQQRQSVQSQAVYLDEHLEVILCLNFANKWATSAVSLRTSKENSEANWEDTAWIPLDRPQGGKWRELPCKLEPGMPATSSRRTGRSMHGKS